MTTITQSIAKLDFIELELKVKKMYRGVALKPEESYHFEMGRALAERLGYPASILDELPEDAIKSFAGVGYHFQLADIGLGEHVVDLGSGSGMDAFLAARQVGKTGKVTGIDITVEQLAKAEGLKKQHGYHQVQFKQANIEEIPLRAESADVVISNGVINLSPRKSKIFMEASRVLKPGGRFVISDIVSAMPLSREIKADSDLWAACVGGAMQETRYTNRIENAGLDIVEIKTNPYEFLSGGAQGATRDYGIKSISLLAIKK
jgi:SAM-dependent methyltransferase